MTFENTEISPETLERLIRQGHVERSRAFTATFRSAFMSVKNIFSNPASGSPLGAN